MSNDDRIVRVLFVCMGNICRSPTAHGVMQKLIDEKQLPFKIEVDSAGTHAYHSGEPPDRRSQVVAEKHGYDLSAQRARKITEDDFENFSLILGMDKDNLLGLRQRCPRRHQHRIGLLMDYAPDHLPRNVPDPYYGTNIGFEKVIDLVEVACARLLEHIAKSIAA